MKWLALLLLIAAALLALVLWERARKKTAPDSAPDFPWPFGLRRQLLGAAEQVLYFRLRDALPEHIVLSQVQLSRVLFIKKGHPWQKWLPRIDRKSLDFLICTKDAAVVAAIELDDSSHEQTGRKKADEDKDTALRSAGVPIIRWHVKSLPDLEAIRAAIPN